MPGQVPVHLARERNRVLRELAAEKNLEFARRLSAKRSMDVRCKPATEIQPKR